jgi:hypothetical protein
MRSLKLFFLLVCCAPLLTWGQDTETESEEVVDKPERPAFESSFIIDNPTDVLYVPNTLEAVIQHRMGLINEGTNDLLGIYGQANIRIGLTYTLHERLQIGFGTEKVNKYQDFNWKVGILRQTRSGRIPVNISYYGNFVIDARKKENFALDQHRYSFFHQVIISRRFTPSLSLQIAPSISHFNVVPAGMNNDVFAIAVGGRFKVSPQTAILLDYSQPFTNFMEDPEVTNPVPGLNALNPKPGFSVGVEFRTSSHAFQIYLSNLKGIISQENYIYNNNDFFAGDILFGFNITRLYNF